MPTTDPAGKARGERSEQGSTDRIQKQILLRAPRSRVWRAISDHREFGRWFRVELGGPFVPGQRVEGRVTYPGYEHLRFEAVVERMEPERLMSFRWHPAAVEPGVDYASEPTTLVVFELEDAPEGVLLRVTESGFDRIPLSRRASAFRMNEEGWAIQLTNVERHVAQGG